jgi:AcrR family transcriptional regulator
MAVEATRARIVAAARDLLSAGYGVSGLSVDAVARLADVARMTVYHQFGSKRGLYEAIADDLAVRAQIGERIGAAFRHPDALSTLDAFVGAFAHFWTVDRIIIRRLQGIAVLDLEIERGEIARNERRRQGLRVVVERVAAQYGTPSSDVLDETVAILHTLTSFATFDNLAGTEGTPVEVVSIVQRLCRAALSVTDRWLGTSDTE